VVASEEEERQVKLNADIGLPERITDCEAYPCDNNKCAECGRAIDSEDHMVLWWGPTGWSVCRLDGVKAQILVWLEGWPVMLDGDTILGLYMGIEPMPSEEDMERALAELERDGKIAKNGNKWRK
jgi:hypothetical protein